MPTISYRWSPRREGVSGQHRGHIEAPAPAGNTGGFEWFPLANVGDANRGERLAAVLPAFQEEVRGWQHRTGASAAATAIIGFSQGAMIALEAIVGADDLAARAVGIAGRFAALPRRVPAAATIHLLHGKEDTVVPTGTRLRPPSTCSPGRGCHGGRRCRSSATKSTRS